MSQTMMTLMETAGILSPLLFISFHLLRPLFFLPVIIICMTGGVLFGTLAGTFYSIIGITLSSTVFYIMIHYMPGTLGKLVHLKHRILGKYTEMTTAQITLLRFIPFMHFHLLSLCLIEISTDFKEYTRSSLLSSIPFVFVYTTAGNFMAKLSPLYISIFMIILLFLVYALRKREYQIKWNDFFHAST